MHRRTIRIGTRESQLAVWQADQVKQLLAQHQFESELVFIKSEGDLDLKTPLYEMGVQGIFTRSLDAALLNDRIDLAVHSMKDVPTRLPEGIRQAAVLSRGPVHDLLVYKHQAPFLTNHDAIAHIATSSLRRKAQWLNKFPHHQLHNLRGNVNTRMRKLAEEDWDAAIFAQAGLERIGLRPANSRIIDWMLPAPAQGAIMIVAREDDGYCFEACQHFNDPHTDICTRIERDFLRTLAGGCSTPISALATIQGHRIEFRGNILSLDGQRKVTVEKTGAISDRQQLGTLAAAELLTNGGREIAEEIGNAVK